MAGASYHNEALRKTRFLERKADALKKMMEQGGSYGQMSDMYEVKGSQPAPIVFSEQGHFAQNRLGYYKTGPTREMRQYDHSRNGPVVDKTNYELRREFNFLGNSLSMMKSDIVPEHKPIPMCRRF